MSITPGHKHFDGFAGDIGITMVDWSLDNCTLQIELDQRHINGIGVVHGGVIATLIDVACAHSGIYCTVPGNARHAFTASLTVNLVGGVKEGTIRAVARKRGGGKTLYYTSADVFDEAGTLIATGEAVCRYSRGSHDPVGVPEK